MRRSNPNLNLFLLTFIMLILICAGATTAYAAEVSVSLPTFDVTMNGVEIEDEYRQYPFIVYKDITYFPMTYFDSRFLGLVTEWDNLKGLEIYKTTKIVEYEPYKQNWKNSNKYTASIPKFNIVVNGKAINNSTEKYPLLSFRNVTYFPMTWRFAVDEFGWKYSFTSEDGLIIDSTPPTSLPTTPENPSYPGFIDKMFEVENDKIHVQIQHYRTPFPGNLYISINDEKLRQFGNSEYVYGVTGYKDNNGTSMQSNDYMELKDSWVYINAFNYYEEDSSRLYKVNIKTGETVPADESDNLNYLKISSYLQEESIKVFSPYYELLGFITFDYGDEEVVNGNIETVFHYTIIYKNYDRDPDTVEYIKEAKERGDKNYQIYYDEYLKPKDMNSYFKAVISENDNITLYSLNLAIDDWYQVKMSDFIIGK